jgi:hypothetical protein
MVANEVRVYRSLMYGVNLGGLESGDYRLLGGGVGILWWWSFTHVLEMGKFCDYIDVGWWGGLLV